MDSSQEEHDLNTSHDAGKYNLKHNGPAQGQILGDYANVNMHFYSRQDGDESSSNQSNPSQATHNLPPHRQPSEPPALPQAGTYLLDRGSTRTVIAPYS